MDTNFNCTPRTPYERLDVTEEKVPLHVFTIKKSPIALPENLENMSRKGIEKNYNYYVMDEYLKYLQNSVLSGDKEVLGVFKLLKYKHIEGFKIVIITPRRLSTSLTTTFNVCESDAINTIMHNYWNDI